MSGWNLEKSEGDKWEKLYLDEEILDMLQNFFSKKTRMLNLYKLVLLKSIIEESFKTKKLEENIFENILEYFGKFYWKFNKEIKVNKTIYNGKSKISSLEKWIKEFKELYKINDEKYYEELGGNLKEIYLEETKVILKKHVLGALYKDFLETIYYFNKSEETIILNTTYLIFFKNNYKLINRFIKYHMYEFLKITNIKLDEFFQVEESKEDINYYEKIFVELEMLKDKEVLLNAFKTKI